MIFPQIINFVNECNHPGPQTTKGPDVRSIIMKRVAICCLILLIGIIMGMNIPPAGAFAEKDFLRLQNQINTLNSRLNLLQTAFSNRIDGTVTIRGTTITVDGSSNISIKAGGFLSLKGSSVTTN